MNAYATKNSTALTSTLLSFAVLVALTSMSSVIAIMVGA